MRKPVFVVVVVVVVVMPQHPAREQSLLLSS